MMIIVCKIVKYGTKMEIKNLTTKIPSSSTLMLIEKYIFFISHIKIYSAASSTSPTSCMAASSSPA
jgi:hypothetical protein